jgi:hypothetical protein
VFIIRRSVIVFPLFLYSFVILPASPSDSQGLPIQKLILGDKFELQPARSKFSVASRVPYGYPEWSKNFEFNVLVCEAMMRSEWLVGVVV